MYTNNNLRSSSVSPSSSSSNSSSSKHYFPPTAQSQVPATSHTPCSSPLFQNTAPISQQLFQHPFPNETQSQTMSKDELDLILSFRKMKNLSFISPLYPLLLSSIYPHEHDLTLQQGSSSAHHIGHQIGSSTLLTPTYHHTSPLIHPFATSTTFSQQLLCAQEIPSKTILPSPPTSTTVTSLISSSPTIPSILPSTTILSTSSSSTILSTSPSSIISSPSPSSIISSTSPSSIISSTSPSSTISSTSSSLTATTTTTLASTAAISSTSPLNIVTSHSFTPQLQLPSPLGVLPSTVSILPTQQHQQTPLNQNLINSSSQHQSTYLQATTYHYNPTITGPAVQLLDPTKPYAIGDTIKVGGRTLQSDASSMKYWNEDDITITETTGGGHILNMAGYSYLIKYSGKNFTTWECEQRRHHQCSTIIVRSSNTNTKHYFRIYSIKGEHIHEPSPENVEIRKFKQRIRDRCREELSCPRTIYDDELMKGKYSSKMLAALPTFYNMQAQLYRIRQENLPTSPTDTNFILHPGFTCTNEGARFLLYDSNAVHVPYAAASTKVGRLLIYCSNLQLNILSKSNRIGSDGTFETAAEISHQNYIIIGEFEQKHPGKNN
ncbi:unnamed protein product [Rotaria sp. Silwood1]|nr:unnamed protein product [Rotaria sp. Silwood1]